MKYKFDDEDWEPNQYQVSLDILANILTTQVSYETHKTNAEELINALPIIEHKGNVVRCMGVQELGLGHPVQYIQLDKRHENTPAVCKWCGLRYVKVPDDKH